MGSVSLTGDINYLDERSGVAPVKVVQGHQKTATAMARSPGGDLYTASYDGVVNRWQPTRAGCTGRVLGKGHGGAGVTGLAPCGDRLLSFGLDDQVQRTHNHIYTHTHTHTQLSTSPSFAGNTRLTRSPHESPDAPPSRTRRCADAGIAAAGGGVR
jgi:WD40 repeat protein